MIATVLFEPYAIWQPTRERPELRERPVVTTHAGRVMHANPLARRAGVTRGMAVAGAHAQASALVTLPDDPPRLADDWRALLDELYGVTLWIASLAPGRALLRLPGADARLLAASYRARVGVAANREIATLAALAANEGQAREVPEGAERAFLDALPLRFLRGVGVDERALLELHWLGVTTVGALARWSRAQLGAYLGPAARLVTPYTHGPWNDRVPLFTPEATVRSSAWFDDELLEPGDVERAVGVLAARLERELGERVALRVKATAWSAGMAFPASRPVKEPLREARVIARAAMLALVDGGALGMPLEGLEVQLAALARPNEQLALWRARRRAEEAIATAAEAVARRFPRALRRIRAVDPWSVAPEERYEFVTMATDDVAGGATDGGADGVADGVLAEASEPGFARNGVRQDARGKERDEADRGSGARSGGSGRRSGAAVVGR